MNSRSIRACGLQTNDLERTLFWHTFRLALVNGAFHTPKVKIRSQSDFTSYYASVFQKYAPTNARFGTKGYQTAKRNRSKVSKDWYFYWKILAAPHSPFYVKETSCGFGVFPHTNMTDVDGKRLLVGFIVTVNEDQLQFLLYHLHQSLLHNGFLIGPLAMVNHECAVPQTYTNSFPSHCYSQFKGYSSLTIKNKAHWIKDEEITVNYGSTFDPCFCRKCILDSNTEEDSFDVSSSL